MNNTLANIFINKAAQSKKIIEIESGVEKTHYEVANRAKEISKSDDIKNENIEYDLIFFWSVMDYCTYNHNILGTILNLNT